MPAAVSLNAVSPETVTANHRDHGYDVLRDLVAARIAAHAGPLFVTDANGEGDALFRHFLDHLPEADRQGYTCSCCRRFFRTYAALATLSEQGEQRSLLWDLAHVPAYFTDATRALDALVRRAKVIGAFVSSDPNWGVASTPPWTHFHGYPNAAMLYKKTSLKNAYQRAAELVQDFGSLSRGLAEFSAEHVTTAVALLEAEVLYRDEKVIGPARFLAKLHALRAEVRGRARDNVVWRAVATAPAGFAHPKSTMISTLLEDIAAGLDFEVIKRNFAAKMDPLKYQRPVAPPSSGQVAAAERLAETLGIGPSLRRRFARLDEVETIWKPGQPGTAKGGGIFGHLLNQPKPAQVVTATAPMTWRAFVEKVLPNAEQIHAQVPGHGPFIGVMTAVNFDAPPILQWDRPERRNPFSHYVYRGGSAAHQWKLTPGAWVEVTGITLMPHQWYGADLPNQQNGAILLLAGAADTTDDNLCLFPETLKSELHGIRSVIEAHSKRGKREGGDSASACGLDVRHTQSQPIRVRVTAKGIETIYVIDRLD